MISKVLIVLITVTAYLPVCAQVENWKENLSEAPSYQNLKLLHKLVDFYSQKDSTTAFYYSENAITMAKELESDSALAQAYLDLSYVYLDNYRYEEAKQWQKQALTLFDKEKEVRGVALVHEAMGLAEVKQGYHESSIQSFFTALRGFEKVADTTSILKSYYHIGYSHYRMRSYDSTIFYYYKILPFCEDSVSENCVAVYNQLGATYTEIQEYSKANTYLQLAWDGSLKRNDSVGAGNAIMNIAGNFFFQQQLDSCAFYLDKAIKMYELTGNKQGQVLGLNNLSIIYEENGKNEQALNTALDAIREARKINDRNTEAGSLLQVMDLNVKLGRPNIVLSYSDSALSIIQELKSKFHYQQYYASLAEAYIKQNDFKQAMEYRELFHAYSDSMVNEQKNKQIAEIETKYETEKKEQEIDILTAETQLQSAIIERNQLIIALISVSAVLGILILIVLFRQRNYKLKAQFESEKSALKSRQIEAVINTQEAERSRFAMDLHDNFGQLISALRLITSQHMDTKTSTDQLLDKMYDALKNLAFDLMPASLVQRDLLSAVDELAGQISQSKTIEMKMTAFVQQLPFDKPQEIGIYRILQELTNNIVKYSEASAITIDLTQQEHGLQIILSDDGVGYDTNKFFHGTSNGWKNISSRLDLLNGEIEIDSSPGSNGSTVILYFPTQAMADAA
jgi:signal transduction histidine kinase